MRKPVTSKSFYLGMLLSLWCAGCATTPITQPNQNVSTKPVVPISESTMPKFTVLEIKATPPKPLSVANPTTNSRGNTISLGANEAPIIRNNRTQ